MRRNAKAGENLGKERAMGNGEFPFCVLVSRIKIYPKIGLQIRQKVRSLGQEQALADKMEQQVGAATLLGQLNECV